MNEWINTLGGFMLVADYIWMENIHRKNVKTNANAGQI